MSIKIDRRPIRFKKSFGIACCRYNLKTKLPEVLMIKKRYTYAFFDFVFARYRKNDNIRLRKLFNQMSQQEKAEILQLDFDRLWARIRIKIPIQPIKKNVYMVSKRQRPHRPIRLSSGYILYDHDWYIYKNKKEKFIRNFIIIDRGEKLKKLIHGTKSSDSIWEIPKGRPDINEKPINTAIREFKEETDISIDKYRFMLNIDPIINSYIINKCNYTHTYYIAVANKFDWIPEINFCSYEQMAEVENLQWVSLSKAKHLNLKQISSHNRMLMLMKKIIKIFKKYYKITDIVPKSKN